MVRYLSDEWLVEAAAALEGAPALSSSVTVGYRVEGGPDGDRRYRIASRPDGLVLEPGDDDADVTLIQPWETACAVARGTRSAQRAFLDGDVRIAGDVRAVLGLAPELASIEDRLAGLRSRTEY